MNPWAKLCMALLAGYLPARRWLQVPLLAGPVDALLALTPAAESFRACPRLRARCAKRKFCNTPARSIRTKRTNREAACTNFVRNRHASQAWRR